MTEISLVIPAYNEQNRIKETLIAAQSTPAKEVVVVCDGKDDTAKIAREVREQSPLKIVVYQAYHRLGKGGAFKEGVKKATGDQIFLVDADFPVPFWFVSQFSKMLKGNDVACVVGSRYKESSVLIGQSLGRRILSSGYRRLVRWMFDLEITDTQCGFKAFKKEPLLKVLHDLKCEGFSFDVELLLRMKKAGYVVMEWPVLYRFKKGSKVSWRQVPEMLWELLQIHQYL